MDMPYGLDSGFLPSVLVLNQSEFDICKAGGLVSDADVESGAVVIPKPLDHDDGRNEVMD